jgi:hypothetical protein
MGVTDTVTVCPPMVRVPVRVLGAGLADALNATVPAPFPLAPDDTVSHATPLLAVHAHPAGAVTATEPDPPATVRVWLVADSE